MWTIFIQMLGWLVFIIVTIVLGAWLRKHPSKRNAERTSRAEHFLYWLCIIIPGVMVLIYPGLSQLDTKLGLRPLPRQSIVLVAGILFILIGAYLFIVSNIALRLLGKGANAFRLTKHLAVKNIYGRMRNPMSLGFYLGFIGFSLLVGSTYITLSAFIAVIPVHVFYLKYFEEYELELRMGQPYIEYKRRVRFMLPWSISKKI